MMTNRLTEWVIEKIKNEYPDDIALLIGIKGHSTDGDDHGECFDYFVPASERGEELAETFIIDGVGHDLYPRSWERLQASVNLNDMAIVLGNAKVLYARSREDEVRFLEMQAQFFRNLADPEFTLKKALQRVDRAKGLYLEMCFEKKLYRVKMLSAGIQQLLSQAAAFVNGTFAEDPLFSEAQAYDACPESRIYSCPDLAELPDGFFLLGKRLLKENHVGSIRETARQLIETTAEFLKEKKEAAAPAFAAEKEASAPDFSAFASWYQELSLTFRRIRFFCGKGMAEQAFCDAANLQSELMEVSEKYGIPEYSLLDAFEPENLLHLKLRADRIESEIRDILNAHGIRINEYDSLQTFFDAKSAAGSQGTEAASEV